MPRLGQHQTEETRRRISEAHRGKPLSEEHRRRIRETHRGKTAETRRKLSEALKGRHISEETRRRISVALKGKYTGWHPSEETRRKISRAHSGGRKRTKRKPMSKETRRKINEALRSEASRRKAREAKTGVKNPNWKGGISFDSYCPKFNERFKERVRAFFGYICQECGTPQGGKRKKNRKKLAVHHVNFRKDSCCAPDAPRLFIPLCVGRGCHGRANINPHFEQYYTDMINGYYGGKCYFTEEEMEIYKTNWMNPSMLL